MEILDKLYVCSHMLTTQTSQVRVNPLLRHSALHIYSNTTSQYNRLGTYCSQRDHKQAQIPHRRINQV